MIPKIIHYCWFGNTEKSKDILHNIESWKYYASDFKIIEWNESNFDINKYEYTKNAYKHKCWAKVSNFVRIWALYHYGGIYLDTDVLILKNIDPLLNNLAFFGTEYKQNYPFYQNDFKAFLIGTAIIGSIENHTTFKHILDHYLEKKFNEFECTEESNNVLLITNNFLDDILNNCTIYGQQILYPIEENELSYCKHLKYDSWRESRNENFYNLISEK